jgi:hypothetical protein
VTFREHVVHGDAGAIERTTRATGYGKTLS